MNEELYAVVRTGYCAIQELTFTFISLFCSNFQNFYNVEFPLSHCHVQDV